MGRYTAYLEHYLTEFSADKVRVVVFRDLTTDPVATMQGLCDLSLIHI